MQVRLGILAMAVAAFAPAILAQEAGSQPNTDIPLDVKPGTPLRLYLTGRVSKRLGVPVQAKIMEPVYSFDREVIPAGTVAIGKVSRTQSIGKWPRVRAILNGDFTPLRRAEVRFTSLRLPDGRVLPAHTAEAVGLNSIYVERPKKPQKTQPAGPHKQNGGILGTATESAKDRIKQAIETRRTALNDLRGPNKKEKLIDFLWSKAPYHPQYWRRGTRFDASLTDPLHFGTAAVDPKELMALGTQPSPDSVAQIRLLNPLSSASAKLGEPVKAVVSAPVFSADHKLLLPEGTRLDGQVVLAKKARRFHRAGQLRFNFQQIELPDTVANLRPAPHEPGAREPAAHERAPMRTQAALQAAEGTGKASIKVDSEGTVQAKESKTRFLAPIISLMVASRAADNDAGRHHQSGAAVGDGNVGGRTLGGGLGLGMAGAAISQTSPYVGMAFGYYGLAWSVYSGVIARGGEVEFQKNAMMDIRFGARTPGSKFLPSGD